MSRLDAISALNPYVAQINPFSQMGQNAKPVDQVGAVGSKSSQGSIPFGQLSQGPSASIAPANAKENYMNGLAPSSNLQNVYAGEYNGKPNMLKQIGIA